ncbi:MAG: tyrosine-type recombinase/integrase [Akkermansia sp.]
MYLGERLTKTQAEKRAMMVGISIAGADAEQYASYNNTSVRALFSIMLNGKLGRVSIATYENARTSYRQFCEWLGKRADEPARLITKADIREWIIRRRSEVRCNTVKKDLSAISSAFAWATDADIMPNNPCTGAKIPPDTKDEKVIHEAFSLDEIRLLIDKLPDEWSSAVRCCIGTYGQRLGDILALRWEQFDWEERTVTLTTGKTANTLIQPMRQDFYDWASERYHNALAIGGDAAIWVHPRLHLHSNPSGEFTQLVRYHGIGLVGKNAGGNRRTWHSKTFHSLRASVATLLHAAGVSQVMAMRLVGHESAAIHSVYVRPTGDQLAAAAAKLPDI